MQFADSYLTAVGIKNGFVEGNPVTRFLFKKLGVAGTNAIKIGALPVVGFFVEYYSGLPGAFNGTMAAVTAVAVVSNFIQLKRKKVSIF
jgi:hypothetical protein